MANLSSYFPAARPAVFFDASGTRWRRILNALLAAVLSVILALGAVLPPATAPLRQGQMNQSPGYPRQLLAQQSLKRIPKVGYQQGNEIFHRIALVERRDGVDFLKDPFSNEIWRQATAEEAKLIGNKPYALEAYGLPPDHTLMLTFDDGPDPQYTPEILDLLSSEGVPATFFVIGENVVENPEIFRRLVREGHMVGNHTMSHIDFWAHNDGDNRQEIIGEDRVLRAADDYASRLFRIPTGNPENNTLALLQAQQLGYLHINMDLDTRDWEYKPGSPVPAPELDGLGHVMLVHDGGGDRTATIEMLKEFIPKAKAEGYRFTTLEPMLPAEFVPQHSASPGLQDTLTFGALTAYRVTPSVVMNWLFWFGVGSLTILTLTFVVLALLSNARQRKRKWEPPDAKDWPFRQCGSPGLQRGAGGHQDP